MKVIGVFSNTFTPVVDAAALHGDPLHFRIARMELLRSINQAGGYGCIVGGFSAYRGKGVFSHHWVPRSDDSLSYDKKGEITVDVIYDKDKFMEEDVTILNPPVIARICQDKGRTFEIAGEFQPRSMVVQDLGALYGALEQLGNGSSRVIVKALVSNGGKEVYIDTITALKSRTWTAFPLLVQEFIDASGGVPGIVSGLHDVRLIILGGEVIAASVRQPKEGSLLSNTSQGGTLRALELPDIPDELLQTARQIDVRLPRLPRFYSADFMYDLRQKRWYLIELNARPGAMARYQGPTGERFIAKLTDYLMAM